MVRDVAPFESAFPPLVQRVRIDCDQIGDWKSFHGAWASAMGFPEFYGRNLDAWIDCMSNLRLDSKMSKFLLSAEEVLIVEIVGTASFQKRVPEILTALIDVVVLTNQRYIESGEHPAVTLLFC